MADNLPAVLALLDQLRPAIEQGNRAKQNDIVSQLLQRRAPMGGQWQQLGLLAAGNGELRLAREAFDLLAEADGGGPVAQYRKASLLALLDAWHDADAVMQAIPADVPDAASGAYSRGIVALNVGRPDEARRYLEEATLLRPGIGQAWLALSMTADFAREPALAGRLFAARTMFESAATAERIPYCYALGKAYADRGEHALAFAAFANGARLAKSSIVYDAAADRASARDALDGYSAERIAAIARRQEEPTGRTIFVAGPPRSGTSLVGQILTAHSAVSGGGEIGRLILFAREIGGQSYSALAGYVEERGAAGAARLWHHWLDELFPGGGRVVDKSIVTGRYLGLAAALLPDAPLVWMTRDPLDRAWSCFRTNFSGNAMPWSYDLRDIAAHFRLEDRLLAEWRRILGRRLLVVPYESLVAEPDSWIRRILAHCGLSEEPQVFAPHENSNPVATASMVQVRRPIHRGGVGSAEPYRQFLEPFIEAYGE